MSVLYMRHFFTLAITALFSMCSFAQVAPSVTIVTQDTMPCSGRAITYSALSSSSDLSYTWSVIPPKGLTSHSSFNSSTVSLVFAGNSTHTVCVTVANTSDGKATGQTIVTPGRSADAAFNASLTSVGFPVDLILTNYSSNSLGNLWRFSDNTTDSSYNSMKAYNKGGAYSVSLFVQGEKGCNDSSSYDFWISDSSGVTLPNVFTPNGDGVNDVFQPIALGISSLNAWVYNRFGELICMWDKPKSGWDGHTTSGEQCSDGVYFVVLEATGFDGKSYKLKGTVTLIR